MPTCVIEGCRYVDGCCVHCGTLRHTPDTPEKEGMTIGNARKYLALGEIVTVKNFAAFKPLWAIMRRLGYAPVNFRHYCEGIVFGHASRDREVSSIRSEVEGLKKKAEALKRLVENAEDLKLSAEAHVWTSFHLALDLAKEALQP
jgi:hypothetical protein